MDEEYRNRVRKLLIGWTIVGVGAPIGREDFCTIIIEKDGVQRTMMFGGTDMGGWIRDLQEFSNG